MTILNAGDNTEQLHALLVEALTGKLVYILKLNINIPEVSEIC